MISPMAKSAAFLGIISKFSLDEFDFDNVLIKVEFVFLSWIRLLISSYNSLSIEKPTTIDNGATYVNKKPTCNTGKN